MEKEKTVLCNKSIDTKVSDEKYAHLEKLEETGLITSVRGITAIPLAGS